MLNAVFVRAWIATFGAFFSFGIVVLALPLYANDELRAGDVGVGVAMGAASVTALLFAAPSGRLADRHGRKLPILAGAAIMTVGYLALTVGPSLPAVGAIRLFAGIGEAAFVIAIYTSVIDAAPDDRHGEATSLATLASYTGLAVGPLAANLMLGEDRFELVWLLATAASDGSSVSAA